MRTFTVTLKTHDARAYRRLAMTLKTALRRDQLKAIFVSEHPRDVPPHRAGLHHSSAVGARTMSLGKRKTGNEFMPTAKFDAKAGVFYSQTRVLGSDG